MYTYKLFRVNTRGLCNPITLISTTTKPPSDRITSDSVHTYICIGNIWKLNLSIKPFYTRSQDIDMLRIGVVPCLRPHSGAPRITNPVDISFRLWFILCVRFGKHRAKETQPRKTAQHTLVLSTIYMWTHLLTQLWRSENA